MPPDEEPTEPTTTPAAPAAKPLPPRGEREADPLRDPATTEASISDIRKRERRAALKDAYGTSDEDEIAKIKQKRADDEVARLKKDEELETLRKDREERERAKMSEVERVTADNTALKQKVKDLEAELAASRQETMGERQTASIKLSATKHRFKAKPAVMKLVTQDFATHFLALPTSEKKRYERPLEAEKALDKWMRTYAKDNPELLDTVAEPEEPTALIAPVPKVAAVVRTAAPIRRPMGSPPPARSPSPAPRAPAPGTRPPGTDANGKVVKPGQPNSMNAKELAAYNKTLGLRSRAG